MSEENQKEKSEGDSFRPQNSGQGENSDREASTGHHGPDERHYTLSISEDERQRSFDIEDERWERSRQIGDWLKLGLVVVIYLAVTYAIYLFEPGIR